tara:strand:- start:575 stop:748 length:174 start_codon:yes stop_codon:yes gene_type:complete
LLEKVPKLGILIEDMFELHIMQERNASRKIEASATEILAFFDIFIAIFFLLTVINSD